MSVQDSNLRGLLSPARSGTFFAPFRLRSANPDGFDSKMRLWINAIEEWAIINKKLTLSLKDIHQIFLSDAGIRPDKECIRLVFSEMKRRSKLVPLNTLKTSRLWSTANQSQPMIDHFIDPKGWLGWGVKKLVYEPATWALSNLTSNEGVQYSDLTDMTITDSMRFVCQKSLHELSHNLHRELVRISKAEKQTCFEWQHLIELITPIVNTIIDVTDGKETLEMLDLLIEYLAINKLVAVQVDNDCKLVKVGQYDDSVDEDVGITRKDIAMARLLRAKELLTADADKYHCQAQRAKQNALECYNRKEVAKAKSLLRSHKRLIKCSEQKETQLNNVENLLEQLENTNSNMMILQAYKDGAEALKVANIHLDTNATILDEVYDATAEAHHLNEEMNQMLRDISCVSYGANNISMSEVEAELNEYLAQEEKNTHDKTENHTNRESGEEKAESSTKTESMEDLEQRLNSLVVCQHPVGTESINRSTPKKPNPAKAHTSSTPAR